jgi:hypothetical protein
MPICRFEAFENPIVLRGARNVVQALEQALLAHRMNLERVHAPVRRKHGLRR